MAPSYQSPCGELNASLHNLTQSTTSLLAIDALKSCVNRRRQELLSTLNNSQPMPNLLRDVEPRLWPMSGEPPSEPLRSAELYLLTIGRFSVEAYQLDSRVGMMTHSKSGSSRRRITTGDNSFVM